MRHEGKILKATLRIKGITHEKFVEMADISRTTLNAIFKEIEIPEQHRGKIERALNVKIRDLSEGIQNVNTKSTGNIIHIPESSYGGFLRGYEDVHFKNSLERWSSPGITGEHFSIVHKGLSMQKSGDPLSLMPNDMLIIKREESFGNMVKGKMYTLQTIEGFITKIFDKIVGETGHFITLNPDYDGEKLPLKSIKVVYMVVRVIKDPYNY